MYASKLLLAFLFSTVSQAELLHIPQKSQKLISKNNLEFYLKQKPFNDVAQDWFLHGPKSAMGTQGINAKLALQQFGIGKNNIVVAVIDSGIDVNHPALSEKIWTNELEQNGKIGVDDDGNGYIDDINGWNFLGDINDGTYEAARTYQYVMNEIRKEKTNVSFAKLKFLLGQAEQNLKSSDLSFDEFKAQIIYDNYQYLSENLKLEISPKDKFSINLESNVSQINLLLSQKPNLKLSVQASLQLISKYLGKETLGSVVKRFNSYRSDKSRRQFNFFFNFQSDFNPYQKLEAQGEFYGDNNVKPKDSVDMHGTHVAGIIAGQSKRLLGVAGSSPAQIMVLRAVPNGDERDKDVAQAIRYAVDNGAKIINMSFGKALSPDVELVREAILYAEENNVLLVHAAGNSTKEITYLNNYPNRFISSEKSASNYITVGASSFSLNEIRASFSNFSTKLVDLFAPGDFIYSSVPFARYDYASGTSMAAPVVSGAAAVILSHYPDLKPAELIKSMKDNVRKYYALENFSAAQGVLDLHKILSDLNK